MIHIFALNIFSRLFESIIAVSFLIICKLGVSYQFLSGSKIMYGGHPKLLPCEQSHKYGVNVGRALPAAFFILQIYQWIEKKPPRPNLPDTTLPPRNDERWKKTNLWDFNNQFQSFSPPLMGGVRGGWRRQLSLMVSSTPSKFCKTSLFQNRKTLNPWLRSHASRRISLSFSSSACCPPSTSISRRLSKATKSTMYSPMGACLLNFMPEKFLPFK
jgi:hypothetical protein